MVGCQGLSVVQLLTEFIQQCHCRPEVKAVIKSLRSKIPRQVSSTQWLWPAAEVWAVCARRHERIRGQRSFCATGAGARAGSAEAKAKKQRHWQRPAQKNQELNPPEPLSPGAEVGPATHTCQVSGVAFEMQQNQLPLSVLVLSFHL